MKILLFCENKYAIDILQPLQQEADKEGGNDVLWYVHEKKIPEFPLAGEVNYTFSIQDAYDFHPDAVYVPGNIVPYYLSGVKIQVFHGYAAEKKDHWVIRRYFDTYFTQGPYFTSHFQTLSKKYGDFEVLETGWTRQDWVYAHRHDYDEEREQLLQRYGVKQIVLYAPTFSPKLTSLPYLKEELRKLAQRGDTLVLMKFHPLTRQEWKDEYKQLADSEDRMLYMGDMSLTKYILMADIMISDTSSAIYEMLLMDKPVVTFRAISKDFYWDNITEPDELSGALEKALHDTASKERRRWVIDNYDPHLDGLCAHRMLEGARDFIHRHGVPEKRKLNLWRKYTSIKTFGNPKRHK